MVQKQSSSLSSRSREPSPFLPSCVPHLDKHDLLGVPVPSLPSPKLPPEGAREHLSPTPPLPTAPPRLPTSLGSRISQPSFLAEAVEFKPYPLNCLPPPGFLSPLHTSLYSVFCSPKPKPPMQGPRHKGTENGVDRQKPIGTGPRSRVPLVEPRKQAIPSGAPRPRAGSPMLEPQCGAAPGTPMTGQGLPKAWAGAVAGQWA